MRRLSRPGFQGGVQDPLFQLRCQNPARPLPPLRRTNTSGAPFGECTREAKTVGRDKSVSSAIEWFATPWLANTLDRSPSRSLSAKGMAVFRHLLPRLGYKSAVWAIAHRLCRLVWKILYEEILYIEQGF